VSKLTVTSVSALICSSIWSRWSSKAAWPAVPSVARAKPAFTLARLVERLLSWVTAVSAEALRSVIALSSALPVALNAAATLEAFSSIVARAGSAVGSAATALADVKKAVSWSPSLFCVRPESIRPSQVAPAMVRARSELELRTSAARNWSAERTTPPTLAPRPEVVALVLPPTATTSRTVATRRE
jgi:hypothetical protein